jgi:hypothetical protein
MSSNVKTCTEPDCGATISWMITDKGKKMPVDGKHQFGPYDPKKHVSHWGTCAKAKAFDHNKWFEKIKNQAVKLKEAGHELKYIQDLVEIWAGPGVRTFAQLVAIDPKPECEALEHLYNSLKALELTHPKEAVHAKA